MASFGQIFCIEIQIQKILTSVESQIVNYKLTRIPKDHKEALNNCKAITKNVKSYRINNQLKCVGVEVSDKNCCP